MDRAETFIREASRRGQPFLAVIWFHAPHTPVVAGPRWRGMYPDATEQEQHYFGCVSAMDAQMGRLVALLDELGQADDTLLWFCSDNGPEGTEDLSRNGRSQGRTGGLRGRKRSLYDGGVGVPALLRYASRLSGGREIDTPCSTLDMLPTICGFMGESVPDDRPIDGTDIWPILSGQTTERDRGIPYRFLERKEQMFGAPSFAWMEGRWKFLSNLDADGEHDQLYDMESDRGETTNVSADHPDLTIRYRTELSEFVESCRRSHAGADYDEPVDMITPFQQPGGWAEDRP
jgi:arylsulfatase A-like enzyme